jgi:hypothetical protein
MYKNEELLSNIEIKKVSLSTKITNSLNENTNSVKIFEQKFMLFLDNYTNNIKQIDKYNDINQVKKLIKKE